MQFDNTRIAIRERDLLDVLDLSLHVIRRYALPWLVTSVIGAAPLAILNWWLLRAAWRGSGEQNWWLYGGMMIVLVGWELPLAAALTTRFFGHAVFMDRPPAKQIVRDLRDSVPQLLLYQVLLRGLAFLPALFLGELWWIWAVVFWWMPFVFFPYLNEVILLERNPLLRKRGRMTTWQRSQALHAGSRGNQFGRWLMALMFATLMTIGMSLTIWYLDGFLTHHRNFGDAFFLIDIPAALWLVAGFFAVARYLSYLDMRIRREGWEVELQVRAEGERLARQIG